ncbi:hypothetical protein [Prochlorococcus marinus]|nr:hypothetical protein [Prochlorococcus marinus]
MNSSNKAENHWFDYFRGSRFGKIIAYGIGENSPFLQDLYFI